MDSSFRASVLLSIPVNEVDAAVEESRKRHERSFDALWGERYKAGIVIVNDGSSNDDFEVARAVLGEFLTKNNILVLHNQSTPDPDHPLLGLKAVFTDNEDVYEMKSVAGSFYVRFFFKQEDGSEVVGTAISSTHAGAGVSPSSARQATVSNFLKAKGPELLNSFQEGE